MNQLPRGNNPEIAGDTDQHDDAFVQKLGMLAEPRGGCAICEEDHADRVTRGLYATGADQLSAQSRRGGRVFYIIQELETPQLSEPGWQIRNSDHAPAA